MHTGYNDIGAPLLGFSTKFTNRTTTLRTMLSAAMELSPSMGISTQFQLRTTLLPWSSTWLMDLDTMWRDYAASPSASMMKKMARIGFLEYLLHRVTVTCLISKERVSD
ncbi:hypothetical protein L596_026942 [Steinernema carpocapsae]|uniref:Uncharacterized protein n=1 Tax=Steinernema carpocapsae TaxID=34508 RepID=A0A4U5M2U7_STECR|nr:hypothetical protein L596_026942 [Steinernema carpocapsae]